MTHANFITLEIKISELQDTTIRLLKSILIHIQASTITLNISLLINIISPVIFETFLFAPNTNKTMLNIYEYSFNICVYVLFPLLLLN